MEFRILRKFKRSIDKMSNPYGITSKKMFILKYIISTLFFIIMIFRTKNVAISLMYFFIIYFIPDFLTKKFQKSESIKLIKEIRELTNNLILLLSANVTFYNALKISESSIKYVRFKEKFNIFVEDYALYNFNMKAAIQKFNSSFNSEEFEMFTNIILQGDKEGKMLEMLEVYSNTLELSMFKYEKSKQRQTTMYILIASILSLVNILIITVYPMIIQIFENLNVIFK
ncbi:MAG: type II secretion system F family protein [Clostridia bacterium]|nr:type II secretion system F family protein [Clostridia bacterium]